MLSKNYYVAFALIIWMIAVNFIALNYIPADTLIPVHYDINGVADKFEKAFDALWAVTAITVAVLAMVHFLPKIDPRIKNVEDTRPAIRGMGNAIVLFAVILHDGMVFQALGFPVDVPQSVIVGMGILFMLMGNFISKTRSNFFVGIRTPWTLSSEQVWIKTHRMAGRLMVPVGGLVLILGAFGLHKDYFIYLIGALVVSALVPAVYSWFAFRAQQVEK